MKNENISNYLEKEVEFKELFNIVWKDRWFVIIFTTAISISAVIYSLSLPNIYRSNALLTPVIEQSSQVSSSMGGISGLANLAGININQSSGGNSIEALDKLKSLSFFINNILPNIYLPNLMAVDSWEASTGEITYDPRYFNKKTNTWTSLPSPQESFLAFNRHLIVSQDQQTGFVTISVKHQSPVIAHAWTELIVNEINAHYRTKDKAEAIAAIDYLNLQMSQTSFSQIKQVIAQLIQQKVQKLTLIEVREFYVYDYIDPPAIMEFKAEPRRSLICIFSTIVGAFFSVFFVLARFFIRQ
jgi:LPS O-antigen subunit length determinant protein (WzzB/FepE family)